jgi:penicillin-binding protein 2
MAEPSRRPEESRDDRDGSFVEVVAPTPAPRPPLVSRVDGEFNRTGGFRLRVGVLGLLATTLLAILGLRLGLLQLVQQSRFQRLAEQQATRIVSLPARRGSIVDARGRLLAGTQPALGIAVDPEALGTIGARGRWHADAAGATVLGRLARLAGTSRATLVERIGRSVLRHPYADAVVLPRVAPDIAFYLDERRMRFPGIRPVGVPERTYPWRSVGSAFLGLLGEIGPSQLGRPSYRGYEEGEIIGRSGIEARYDRLLRGGLVTKAVRVDAAGREIGAALTMHAPRPPRTLRLTVDLALQRAAENAIAHGIRLAHRAGHEDAAAGAAVVMDARTGAIYALASSPRFDVQRAARDPRYLARLLSPRNRSRPLLDRAVQGVYPAGSTFKPIVAAAALDAGVLHPGSRLFCSGSFQVGDTVFRNVEPGVYASLTLPQALQVSCDTWFYRVGAVLYSSAPRALQRTAHRLGFGQSTGIDVPGEAAGLVPTPAWLRRTYGTAWHEGDSVNLSIGQGYLEVTPLQLAVAYAALANGGTVVRPHLADAVLGPNGRVTQRLRFPPARHVHLRGLAAIRRGLFEAAHAPDGTSAAIFGGFDVPVAGKTGTAQAPPGSDHSWYASWAPAGNPKVVVVVLIEHGGFGAEAAAPAAKDIYAAYFHRGAGPKAGTIRMRRG